MRPELPLCRLSEPPVPSRTTARLAMVSPATKLRVEAVGTPTPVGNAVTNPDLAALVTVRLMATALAVVGTPAVPDTFSALVARPASEVAMPRPVRVSSTRVGGRSTKVPFGPGAGAVVAGVADPAAGAATAAGTVVSPVTSATSSERMSATARRWYMVAPDGRGLRRGPAGPAVGGTLQP